jgi:hypothetical protein
MPLYPRKCFKPKSGPQAFDFSVVSTLDSLLSLSKNLGAHHYRLSEMEKALVLAQTIKLLDVWWNRRKVNMPQPQ